MDSQSRNMYGTLYSGFVDYMGGREGFDGSAAGDTGVIALAILMIVALVIVQLFIVQWLWNTVLVRVTTVVKPLPSLMYALGLLILLSILNPASVVA